MKPPEELIQKYMDGVLTPEEDVEIRGMLSDDELSRIKTDKALYQEILKRIADAPPCPCAVWETIQSKLTASADAVQSEPMKFPSFLSFAAMLIIGFGVVGMVLFLNPSQPQSATAYVSSVQFASAIPNFAAQADVHGEVQDLLASLKANGFDALDLSKEIMIGGHKIKALGIKYCECSGKKERFCKCCGHKVAQFLFECCGKPIIVLVSTKGAPIGQDSFKLNGMKNFHIASTEIGNYRLVAAGPHPPSEVLKLFSNKG